MFFILLLVFSLSRLTHSLSFASDYSNVSGSSSEPEIGIYYYADLSKGIVLEKDPLVIERCHRDDWMFNPHCCCTHNWCHQVDCKRIRMNGDETATVELFPGDHPRVLGHVIWKNVQKHMLTSSPDADKNICHVCASGISLSCVLYSPGGMM